MKIPDSSQVIGAAAEGGVGVGCRGHDHHSVTSSVERSPRQADNTTQSLGKSTTMTALESH